MINTHFNIVVYFIIIRRTHWYVDACHRCKGVGSESKINKKNIYYRTALSLNL